MTARHDRLSGEDLTFWWFDSPVQPTTMAMLLVLSRRPDERRLGRAFARAIAAVPRLAQRVVDAPLDLTLPHWEADPTFDLDYHLRHHGLPPGATFDELLREIAPTYETPFDRTRPLWEARLYEGRPDGGAALFFKLHHAVADGVGANAIFAALTDWEAEPADDAALDAGLQAGVAAGGHAGSRSNEVPPPAAEPGAHAAVVGATTPAKGGWTPEASAASRLFDALRDRADLEIERAVDLARSAVEVIRHPERVLAAFQGLRSLADVATGAANAPVERFGRARRLTGIELPFEELRELKRVLRGTMIDVLLTIMARAIGRWHAEHDLGRPEELMTLVPVNLRRPEEWTEQAAVGNVATGLMIRLPIGPGEPLARFAEIRRRVEERKADPSAGWAPALSQLMSALPRPLFTWMAGLTFGTIDFIVTNVPGILVPRYLAGAEIRQAYPFAPVAVGSPVSVALYGYRSSLFIGLDSDERSMPDVEVFQRYIVEAFEELRAAANSGDLRA